MRTMKCMNTDFIMVCPSSWIIRREGSGSSQTLNGRLCYHTSVFDEFPEFSRRKKELKETEEGVLEVSSEYQKVIDNVSEKASNDTLKLTVYLMKNGRDDDIEKAEKDPFYLKELLAEFRNGVLGAN